MLIWQQEVGAVVEDNLSKLKEKDQMRLRTTSNAQGGTGSSGGTGLLTQPTRPTPAHTGGCHCMHSNGRCYLAASPDRDHDGCCDSCGCPGNGGGKKISKNRIKPQKPKKKKYQGSRHGGFISGYQALMTLHLCLRVLVPFKR